MFASFEYRLTKEEYSKGLRFVAVAIALRDRRRTLRAAGQIAFLGLILAIASFLEPAAYQGVFLALALVAVSSCVMAARRLRFWHELTFDPDLADATVTMDSDGVVKRHRSAEYRWTWDALRQVHDLPGAVVLQFADCHAIILPDRLWVAADERSAFIRQVREHATALLPDLPPEMMRASAAFNWPALGSFAAALLVPILSTLLTLNLISPIRQLLEYDRSRIALFGAFWITTGFILMLVVGHLAKAGLVRLKRHHPRVASVIAAMLIAAFAAALFSFPPPACAC